MKHLILISFAFLMCLTGCVNYRPLSSANAIAWDGLGEDPNRPRKKAFLTRSRNDAVERNEDRQTQQLSGLHPFSREWWGLYEDIEAARDAKLAEKLVICRKCGMEGGAQITGVIQ